MPTCPNCHSDEPIEKLYDIDNDVAIYLCLNCENTWLIR
jgi:transposase-like protein